MRFINFILLFVSPEDRHGKENQTCTNSSKSSKQSICKGQTTKSPFKKLPVDNKSPQKRWDPLKKQVCRVLRVLSSLIGVLVKKREFLKSINVSFPIMQQELRMKDQPIAEMRNHSLHDKPKGGESPNIISENILKCLSSILLRMSTVKNLDSAGNVPHSWTPKSSKNCVEGSEFWDPYGICLEFGKREIGPYKQLCAIEAKSFDPKRTAKSLFLLHRLKYVILYKLLFFSSILSIVSFRCYNTLNLENLQTSSEKTSLCQH